MIKQQLAQKSRILFTLVPNDTVLSTFTYCPNILGFEEGDGRRILRNVIKIKYFLQGSMSLAWSWLLGCSLRDN